jgi:hypothetical protein
MCRESAYTKKSNQNPILVHKDKLYKEAFAYMEEPYLQGFGKRVLRIIER